MLESHEAGREFLVRACGILIHDDSVLAQEADDGARGKTYALPGGHLEFGERLAVCMARFSHAGAWRYLLIASWILMAVPEPFLPGFSDTGTPSTIQSLAILSLNFYGLLACFIAQTQFPAVPSGTAPAFPPAEQR